MYTEEYESRGFPFRDLVIKIILVAIFAFILIWLLPKFMAPTVINKTENSKKAIDRRTNNTDISPLTSQIFADNLERMKDAAISYYTDERLPQEVGESDKMTLSDMIGKKLIIALIDKNNKACDVEKSYVKITKLDEEYILKVNLKDSEKEDYILVHLGCYTYCNSYVCEKKEVQIDIKGSKPNKSVPIIKNNTNKKIIYPNNPDCSDNDCEPNNPSNPDKPTSDPSNPPTDNPSLPSPTSTPPEPPKNKNYLYEYQKTTQSKMSNWTSWSNWSKTNCATQEINCSDSNTSCVRKLQRYNRKEKIGTYQKKYTKTRNVLRQTGSYKQKSCSKYNYVIVNNTTYATTTTKTYTTVNTITNTTAHSVGGWTYNGRDSYSNPPSSSSTRQYIFVGADYSYCNETCTSLPNYYYDSYTYTGAMSPVNSTTSIPSTTSSSSSSTTSSTSSSVTASCGSIVTKTIPIYKTIQITDIASRTEPLYGTVCYQSTKTRKMISAGKTTKKWSKYNDKALLNNGWQYTGNIKREK